MADDGEDGERRLPDRHEFGFMRAVDADHSGSSFVGSGSGIHFVRAVYRAAMAKDHDSIAGPTAVESDAVPGEDDHPASAAGTASIKSAFLWHDTEVSRPSTNPSVSFSSLTRWSESYWDLWHPGFPFLHAPTVLKWFETIATYGVQDAEPQRLIIVRSILSIALADCRQNATVNDIPSIPARLVWNSIDTAVESVQSYLAIPPSIINLQAILSVQLFLVSMLHHNSASRLGGLIVRMAQQMGLHRCPFRYSTFTQDEALLRQRIFWAMYCIDRQISQSLGLPLGLRDDDFDVCSFKHERHVDSSAHVMDSRLAVSYFFSRFSELKGRILELCNKTLDYRPSSMKPANLITAEISQTANEIDDFTSVTTVEEPSISAAHLTVLEVLRQECVIALYRPLLTMSKRSSEYKVGLQLCISAARSIVRQLNEHLNATASNTSRPASGLLWPSMTWAVWMSAFVAIRAAMENEMSQDAALILIHQCIELLKHLGIRETRWPNACAVAIEDLKENMIGSRFATGVSLSESRMTDPMLVRAMDPRPNTHSEDRTLHDQVQDQQYAASTNPNKRTRMSQATEAGRGWQVREPSQANVDLSAVPDGVFASATSYNNIDPFGCLDIPFWLDESQIDSTWIDSWSEHT